MIVLWRSMLLYLLGFSAWIYYCWTAFSLYLRYQLDQDMWFKNQLKQTLVIDAFSNLCYLVFSWSTFSVLVLCEFHLAPVSMISLKYSLPHFLPLQKCKNGQDKSLLLDLIRLILSGLELQKILKLHHLTQRLQTMPKSCCFDQSQL